MYIYIYIYIYIYKDDKGGKVDNESWGLFDTRSPA